VGDCQSHRLLHKIQEKGNLDDHQKEVLAKFGYKQDMKTKNKKKHKHPSIYLATYSNHV
jgi:hypothetical protein